MNESLPRPALAGTTGCAATEPGPYSSAATIVIGNTWIENSVFGNSIGGIANTSSANGGFFGRRAEKTTD